MSQVSRVVSFDRGISLGIGEFVGFDGGGGEGMYMGWVKMSRGSGENDKIFVYFFEKYSKNVGNTLEYRGGVVVQ
jgi:hypothetical protein